jgi:hypothetical protein
VEAVDKTGVGEEHEQADAGDEVNVALAGQGEELFVAVAEGEKPDVADAGVGTGDEGLCGFVRGEDDDGAVGKRGDGLDGLVADFAVEFVG